MDAGRPERMIKMAKLVERIIHEDIGMLAARIQKGIVDSSISASVEDVVTMQGETSKCIVMVFERYSYMGSNRVSMNVTLFQEKGGPVQLTAITSGGSQAMFFKINTFGEEAFLDKLREIL